jgi:shikimate dehydrogenase
MNISAATGLIGLFGHPVEHSLSPLFMNRALKALHLNSVYLAFDVHPEEVEYAVDSLRVLGLRGVNVTIPHKKAVLHSIDSVEEDARFIGAVNCIKNDGGVLHGHNTDHLGFLKPLEKRHLKIRGLNACVLGCGGAARSVLYALVNEGIEKVYLVNRTETRAEEFLLWVTEVLNFQNITYIGNMRCLTQDIVDDSPLLINTTPVGMFPHTGECPMPEGLSLTSRHVVYDLIYNPWETMLLQRSAGHGAKTINGFEMLIVQGLYSLLHWFPDKKEKIFLLQDDIVDYTRGHLSTLS